MKKIMRAMAIIMCLTVLICLSGCGKSESDYKSAISTHMSSVHGSRVMSYDSFNMDSNGASASIRVSAQLEMGGTIEMSNQIRLDKDCNVASCSWCD